MNTIIYRKSDLRCVQTVSSTATVEQEMKLNVIPNFGGVAEDYGVIETDEENFHLENISGIVTVVENIPSLETVKQTQKDLISQSCQNAIMGGFHSTAYQGIDKIYDSTLEDQANITGNALSAVSKVSGVSGCEDDKFYYHARGEEFVEWQPEECLQLARDFKIFKEQQLIRNKQLQAYVETLATTEEVQAITWDTVIPTSI